MASPKVGKTFGTIKTVTEFLSDAIDGFKGTGLIEAIARAAPWVGIVGEAFADAVPPVKFLIKFFEKVTKEHNPQQLGLIACTMAYEQSFQQAIVAVGDPKNSKKATKEARNRLKEILISKEIDFKKFSFGEAVTHPFIVEANSVTERFAELVGFSSAEWRRLQAEINSRFVGNLKTILSHGKLKERFEPFTQMMELGTGETRAYEALYEHADYQRWLFEEAPVFSKEPFALGHVYIDTECGKVAWGDLQKEDSSSPSQRREEVESRDPFNERVGGRHSMVETVIDLIGDPNFNDAVVIQGVAGSGKSSFTLRLCSELIREGLRPICIRLRNLRFDIHVREALIDAIRFTEEKRSPENPTFAAPDDLFLDGRIFKESVKFRDAVICPYVLILDGWDEISISVSEGFKVRVEKMLEEIRSEYLTNQKPLVRVVMTGRPSEAVSESKFLRKKTALLTVRPIRADQLEEFVARLRTCVAKKPIPVVESEPWSPPDSERFAPVLARYADDFAALNAVSRYHKEPDPGIRRRIHPSSTGSMDILGLPLLAHLAIRLMSQWPGDLTPLVENPTTLYRSLVDLTCEKAGKAWDDPTEIEGQTQLSGNELRRMLRQTAVAMTVLHEESISYEELSLRLDLTGDKLQKKAALAVDDNKLTSLMISFFFKGGRRELGCEFLHKSFREYLLAESIVEIIKEYGRNAPALLPQRENFWEEFETDDERFDLSRKLSNVIAPQWMTPEVANHVAGLISWEIDRSYSLKSNKQLGTPTASLRSEEWERVRDGLADLWDWWAEGVHLRPQPSYTKRREIAFAAVFAQELIEWIEPMAVAIDADLPATARITSIDSHLGDSLFRICQLVHYSIAITSDWLLPRRGDILPRPSDLWTGVSEVGSGPRRCQCEVTQPIGKWTLFAPSGADPAYFANYVARINAAGGRPLGVFPLGAQLSGVDLRNSAISIPIPPQEPVGAVWRHANLTRASLTGCFYRHDLSEVLLSSAQFWLGFAAIASFQNSELQHASFRYADLTLANLEQANLEQANLTRANLERASLRDANLEGADLQQADLKQTNLVRANLKGANLEGVDLKRANLEDSDLRGDSLKIGQPEESTI